MIIGLDFDGTVVQHAYPDVGDPLPGCIEWLHKWQDAGARIILWTMRSGSQLEAAVQYLATHDVRLWGINGNPEQKSWTTSPKAHCDLYVDDRALGVPLVMPPEPEALWYNNRPYVDWAVVGPQVFYMLSRKSS